MATKTYDPQITVEGTYKELDKSDVIVFTIPLGPLHVTCIVTVPVEPATTAPVYCKLKFRPPRDDGASYQFPRPPKNGGQVQVLKTGREPTDDGESEGDEE